MGGGLVFVSFMLRARAGLAEGSRRYACIFVPCTFVGSPLSFHEFVLFSTFLSRRGDNFTTLHSALFIKAYVCLMLFSLSRDRFFFRACLRVSVHSYARNVRQLKYCSSVCENGSTSLFSFFVFPMVSLKVVRRSVERSSPTEHSVASACSIPSNPLFLLVDWGGILCWSFAAVLRHKGAWR